MHLALGPAFRSINKKMDKAEFPELALMSDGDDTSSESFNTRDKKGRRLKKMMCKRRSMSSR
jgi:hypothetical protein